VYDIIITLALTWRAQVVDYDESIHKHIALLQGVDAANNWRHYAVSVESDKPFKFKENETVEARITMNCIEGVTIDEAMSDKFNQWIHYIVMGCNATKVEYPIK